MPGCNSPSLQTRSILLLLLCIRVQGYVRARVHILTSLRALRSQVSPAAADNVSIYKNTLAGSTEQRACIRGTCCSMLSTYDIDYRSLHEDGNTPTISGTRRCPGLAHSTRMPSAGIPRSSGPSLNIRMLKVRTSKSIACGLPSPATAGSTLQTYDQACGLQ
ncbi:hypothetical protein C2E23DRAFT_493478 [Lenzites betulinus]|nr:hypothetical protein C2E23DRAFT_493478 [Lenzites betulinus]